jgi:hypothetical protein
MGLDPLVPECGDRERPNKRQHVLCQKFRNLGSFQLRKKVLDFGRDVEKWKKLLIKLVSLVLVKVVTRMSVRLKLETIIIDMFAVLVTEACELGFSEGGYKFVSKVET